MLEPYLPKWCPRLSLDTQYSEEQPPWEGLAARGHPNGIHFLDYVVFHFGKLVPNLDNLDRCLERGDLQVLQSSERMQSDHPW